ARQPDGFVVQDSFVSYVSVGHCSRRCVFVFVFVFVFLYVGEFVCVLVFWEGCSTLEASSLGCGLQPLSLVFALHLPSSVTVPRASRSKRVKKSQHPVAKQERK
ncbi:unnamed protein product, partial [Hapterophycus canaliculatus]